MRKRLEWAAFIGALALTILVFALAASPLIRNAAYFTVERAWHTYSGGGRALPIAVAQILRPSVPIWVQVEPHLTMLLDRNDYVDRTILVAGVWEPETWHSLSEHIQSGAVFVDVGAHIGYYSLKAAKVVGPGGRVLAIEPNPETVRRLRGNIQASGAPAITVVPVACSDSDGTLELFAAAGGNTSASSLSKENASNSGPVTTSFHVQARRLDAIIEESGVTRVDVIKIDVEGAELTVLKGAQETLDRYHPVVTVELIESQLKSMGTSSAEVARFFKGHGYTARHSYGVEFNNTEFVFTPGVAANP